MALLSPVTLLRGDKMSPIVQVLWSDWSGMVTAALSLVRLWRQMYLDQGWWDSGYRQWWLHTAWEADNLWRIRLLWKVDTINIDTLAETFEDTRRRECLARREGSCQVRDNYEISQWGQPRVQTPDWRQTDIELCEGFITSLHQIGDRYGGALFSN